MNSKQIKILFISHEFGIGGATVSLISLIQGLKECYNIEISVLFPYKKSGTAKRVLSKNNINFKQMWYRRNYKMISERYSLKFHVFDFLNILAVKRIQNYIEKQKFDIICSNSTGVDVGAKAAKLAKVPHIYYIREFMDLDHKCEYRNKKRMRDLLENSEFTIFISKSIEKYYKTKYKLENTAQFYNGFVVQEYYINEHDILNKEKIYFIQLGAFQEGKGTINTIEMLYHLNQSGLTEWTMEFVGNGTEEYINKMKKLILEYHLEDKITIGEFCFNIKEKLSCKDILIMNSKSEGFGRVTVEGMLAGCLVIGRNSGGTKEIVEDKVNGVLFDNEKDFINSVRQIYNEPDTYKNIAQYGQKYALEKFDCVNTAKNFMNVVDKCMQQRERRDE